MNVEFERVAMTRRSLRVQIEQLRRGVVGLLGGLLFRFVPLPAAQLVQWRSLRRGAAIATDQMQARHRYVELGVIGVQQMQELVWAFTQVERGETKIAADAVLLMHDRIADADFGQIPQHGIDVGPAALPLAWPAHDASVELRLGEQRELRRRPHEAAVQWAYNQRAVHTAGGKCRPIGNDLRLEVVFGEVLLHRLATAEAFGG